MTNRAEKLRNLVSDGKWFKVTFVKKDGTLREMTCRTGVSAYVKGTGKEAPNHIIRVWERAAGKEGAEAYRCFNVDRVVEVRAHGKVFNEKLEEVN